MQGYQVSMRIESFKKEIKPPAPGQRDQQMAISVKLTVEGIGASKISTGIGFFDHMLDQLARHSLRTWRTTCILSIS